MIEKKNLIINQAFASAVENHKKGNFQIAEKFYREMSEREFGSSYSNW